MCDFSSHLKIMTKVRDFYSIFFHIRWNKILQKVPATRIMFLPHKEIVCKNFHATGRNFLSFEMFCSVTGKYFLSQEAISCYSKKFPVTVRNFLLQYEISSHSKKFPVTVRNFLSQEKISVKTFHVTGSNILSQ